MARNDLRARGGLGGARSAPPTRCWGGAKRHPKQLVDIYKEVVLVLCVSSDVMSS